MSEDYIDVAFVGGERAIVYGYDREGTYRDRELTRDQMDKLCRLQARHNAVEQKLLAEFLA